MFIVLASRIQQWKSLEEGLAKTPLWVDVDKFWNPLSKFFDNWVSFRTKSSRLVYKFHVQGFLSTTGQ